MKNCAHCDGEFAPNAHAVSRQKYCGITCQKAAWHKRAHPSQHGEMRQCQQCGATFIVHMGLQRYCSAACRGAAARVKVPQRWRHAKSRYGLTREDIEDMFTAQGGQCAICSVVLKGEGLDRDSPQVDHCHDSGQPREILCRLCNTALGNFRDDPELIRKALAYLLKWSPDAARRSAV